MPFYEFYCPECHKIMTFFSPVIDTTKQPDCPHCGHITQRQISRFIVAKDLNKATSDTGGFRLNDPKTQKILQKLNAKAGSLQNDPASAARLLKELSSVEGALQNPKLNKLLDQLEKNAGNPEIETELEALVSEIERDSESEFGATSNPKNAFVEPLRDHDVYDL